jgi:hypothetical protein
MVEEILEYIDSYVDMETATLCMLYERKVYAMNSTELKIAKEKNEKELIGEENVKQNGVDVKHYEVKKVLNNGNRVNNNHDASSFQDYLDKSGYTIVQELITHKKLR